MAYVDGFVVPVPVASKDAYRALAAASASVFRRHGAMKLVECWGDDVPPGVVTSFPLAVKLEPGEVVVFSWIWWPDKATRDAGNAAAQTEMEALFDPAKVPFDARRLIYGGFEVLLDS